MLSIVVPAYNEEKNISNAISRITKFFTGKKLEHELIIVNDGSTDRTANVVEKIARKNKRIILVNNPMNMGKGYAVKNGVMISKGAIIFMIDADLSMSVEEYDKLARWNKSGYDFIIGSKRITGAKMMMPAYRKVAGALFGKLVNLLIVNGIKDTQCGFKLFVAKKAKEVFKEQKINGFSFDAEILYLANKKGFSIKEVPINLNDNSRISKVHLIKDSIKMFFDLIKIRLIHR